MDRRSFLLNSGGILAISGSYPAMAGSYGGTEPHTTGSATVQIPFSFVDVFAEQPLTGNPLSIVPQAEALDDATMQRIAAELNQAETTFILPARQKSADWRLRSFTAAGHEIFGAGHNSLGAWWWLAESGRLKLREGRNQFTQEIGESLLPVEVQVEAQRPVSVILTQSAPVFGRVCEELAELAAALGLEKEDLLEQQLPTQVVSTGVAHLLVPVRSRTVIARAHPDSRRLAKALKDAGGEGCYVYCLDAVSSTSTAHARFFNPTVGIVEDAATGTAAGPLACQLVRHGIAKDGTTITIEQGYEMKRPSLLRLEVQGQVVRLAGHCVRVIDGTLRYR